MYWGNWQDFFAMGGYALYVWGSFGLSALLVSWEVWTVRQRRLIALQRIQQLQ
jgi:heme exporter protein D